MTAKIPAPVVLQGQYIRLEPLTLAHVTDLFVDPAHRGAGVADALIREVRRIAAEKGWAAVRWLTGDDNFRAQAVYERHARRVGLQVYQVASGDGGA